MFLRGSWVPRDVLTYILDYLPLCAQTRCKRVCRDLQLAVRRVPLPPPISKDFHQSYVLDCFWTSNELRCYAERLGWLQEEKIDLEHGEVSEIISRGPTGKWEAEVYSENVFQRFPIEDTAPSPTVSTWRAKLRSNRPTDRMVRRRKIYFYPLRTATGTQILIPFPP